jgi:AcrR family transcriptional regulator
VVTDTEVRPDTREELIRSAERLFAGRGIDGVSLREITRAAGQRNTSALQYHFGDRPSLLQAVIDKHRADTEPRRHALLDQCEAESSRDLRALAAALVLPLAAKLTDPDGGRAYLQINCEVYTRPSAQLELVPRRDAGNSMLRWHAMLDPLLPEEERKALHTRFPAIRLAFVELARRAESPPRRDDRLFTSHLTDLVTALLASRPSGPTLHLLDLRTRPGSPGREGLRRARTPAAAR